MSKKEVLVLMGFPGAGKSTYAKEFCTGYQYVNQDTLGTRDVCIKVAAEALEDGMSVVVDRCNHNRDQRRYWIKLAQDFGVNVRCLYLAVDPEECIARICARRDHPTITQQMPVEKKREIVAGFLKTFELPSLDEGFSEVILRRNG